MSIMLGNLTVKQIEERLNLIDSRPTIIPADGEDKEERMIFTIPGEPTGKARPRVVKGHAYTPAKTKAYEDKVRWCFKQAHGKLIDGPVAVAITAYHAIPRKASKAVREAMESGARLPLKKPDADNIAKAICDALNGIAYKDDSQIVALLVFKRFGEPRVEVNIMGGDLCSSAV